LTSVLVTAVSGYGLAFAQDEEAPAEEGEATPDESGTTEETGEEPAAEEPGDETGDAAAEAGAGHRGMTMGKGAINVDVVVAIGLSDGAEGDPISISPDIWYGVGPKLDLGLVHSTMGTTGFVGLLDPASICVTGDFCDFVDPYHNVGLEGRFALKDGSPMGLAVNGGLFARNFDPFQLALKAGIMGRYMAGKISVEFAPNIFIGITERDSGNEEFLFIPVLAVFHASPKLGIGVQSGILGPLDGFGDAMQIPLSVGAHIMATDQIGLGAAFSFPAIVGGDAVLIDGVDARTLTVWANYRMPGS
jgi:hypothetical protein